MRPATPDEIINWDSLVTQNPSGGDIFQGKVFATVKQEQGWTPQYMVYVLGDRRIYALYLSRKVPLLGELWYAAKGPGVTTRADLNLILKANNDFATGKNIFVFKIDPELPKSPGYPNQLVKAHNVQANANTVNIDLKPDEESILASFRQRARRAIRQAQATGIQVKPVSSNQQTYNQMYELFKLTGSHGGFYVRSQAYLQRLWQLWSQADQGQFFFAYQDNKLIAAAFVTYFADKGLYKDGASDHSALRTGAAYLLQWEVMRWLKAHGLTVYDLHGTPPADQLENKDHHYYGMGLFKTSFSNELTEYVGTLDQVIKPAAYRRWQKLGDRLAQSLEYRLRGRTFY